MEGTGGRMPLKHVSNVVTSQRPNNQSGQGPYGNTLWPGLKLEKRIKFPGARIRPTQFSRKAEKDKSKGS